MSADSWTTCPACEEAGRNDVSKYARAKKELDELYGKIPADDYAERLRRLSSLPTREEEEETLREDFQIGIFNGEFTVEYGAHCTVCGWSFEYDNNKKFSPEELKTKP